MGFFEPSVKGGGGGHDASPNVTALMVIKFGTGMKLDVFYTMTTKKL